MLNMNGVELQSVTYNGVEVQTWTHDGVEVYSAFTPFYVIENGLLVDGNYTSANRINVGTHSGYNLDYGYYGITTTDSSRTGATVTFDARGAKTLEIVAEEFATTTQRTVTFEVRSEDTVLYTSSQTGMISASVDISGKDTITVNYYSTGRSGQQGCKITKIYCTR